LTSSSPHTQLRLRVFAGPNGSGKSTVIKSIREAKENGYELDFGIYINADDIAKNLSDHTFSFTLYEVKCVKNDILNFAKTSGLLKPTFTIEDLSASISINGSNLKLKNKSYLDNIAQLLSRYLREALLIAKKRFSFETVFSHPSNLDTMREAIKQGYKVYLYFVSTESPEINKFRVKLRVEQGGHDVPPKKIESRYYSALSLLYEAAEISYQAFFFDNSSETFKLVAHFKKLDGKKNWDDMKKSDAVGWFSKYYLLQLKQRHKRLPKMIS